MTLFYSASIFASWDTHSNLALGLIPESKPQAYVGLSGFLFYALFRLFGVLFLGSASVFVVVWFCVVVTAL